MISIACADCGCSTEQCGNKFKNNCKICIRQICCCQKIHRENRAISVFLYYVKSMYATALAIEILCVTSAEIGVNTGLHVFGWHGIGITLSYIMGYSLAAFTTFITILGRTKPGQRIDSCCSVLDQQANKGFVSNLILTFRNFGIGFSRLFHLLEYPDLKGVIVTSLFILITAESACILTAETVDLIFYRQSVLLSAILGLLIGSFTVVAIEAYKKIRSDGTKLNSNCRK